MQCPVCKTESDHAEICPRCHFKLKVFISMTPEEELQYKAELEKARKEWKLRCEMPAFERDVFETREEFKARIESQNPYPAGKAKLLRNKYDIDRAIFPRLNQALLPIFEHWENMRSPTFGNGREVRNFILK